MIPDVHKTVKSQSHTESGFPPSKENTTQKGNKTIRGTKLKTDTIDLNDTPRIMVFLKMLLR